MAPRKVKTQTESGKKMKNVKMEMSHSISDTFISPPPGFENVCLSLKKSSMGKRSIKSCSVAMLTKETGNYGVVPTKTHHGEHHSGVLLTNGEGRRVSGRLKVVWKRSKCIGCGTCSPDNNTVQVKPIFPQYQKNEHDSSNMNQLAYSVNSSARISEISRPALFDIEDRNQVNLENCPGEQEKNQALSFNLSEMDLLGASNVNQDEVESTATVTVAGCILREEFVATARVIESKHGDILARSGYRYEGIVCSHLFEGVCTIYQKLERTTLTEITLPELERLRNDVNDLLKAKVNVGWLAKRLDDIHHATQIFQAGPSRKEQRDKNTKNILELEKKVQLHKQIISEHVKEVKLHEKMLQEAEKKLELKKGEAERTRQEHISAKHPVMRFYKKSLVEGI